MPTRLAVFALVICLWGCESDDNDPLPTAPRETVLRPSGELQPWDLSPIVPIDSVRTMPTGTPVFLRTEFANGQLADLEMTFVRVVDTFRPPMPVYMVEASDPVLIQLGGIARGMSGSPIFTEQGTWGAIAYGFSGQDSPPYYFFATPIEWVIGTQGAVPLAKPAATWEGNRIAPLAIPLLDTGFNGAYQPHDLEVTPAGKTQQPQESFEAGRPLAVGLVLGENTMASLGTISYVDGNRVYGFGHPMSSAGPVELPIIEAQVLGEVSSTLSPFKFATLNPTVRGTLTEDRLPAVRGILNEEPELVPLRSVYTFSSGSVLESTHRLATVGVAPSRIVTFATRGLFAPLTSRVENEPNHSVRLRTHISFVGTDSILARSRLYADRDGGLSSAIQSAQSDLSDVLNQLIERDDYALQLREAEVHVELVPESRFAKVVAVAADTVVRAGSTLPVTTSLRVGRSSNREIELALSVPDTLPVGAYQLEVGSAATLSTDPAEEFFSGPSPRQSGVSMSDETLDELFARLNRTDQNALLSVRLTFVRPLEEGDALFGAYTFPPTVAVSTQEELDLFLEGVQTLEVQVVED